MYRPPQNTNIVKSIKSKFENIENKPPEKTVNKNGCRSRLQTSKKSEENPEGKQILQRQISDPLKRNIKRTPAFRVDKSVERTNGFQRNSYNRSTLFENKVKQFSAVKNNCDNNNFVPSESTDIKEEILKDLSKNVPKTRPILIKSKSSHDFQYIRNKFDKGIPNNSHRTKSTNLTHDSEENLVGVDLSLLYTEPVPKFLRNKNILHEPTKTSITIPETNVNNNNIYNVSTLKISEKKESESLENNSTQNNSNNGLALTDTLKIALKKPLPRGPAPKKPPRTFQHSKYEDHIDDLKKNISFLHINNQPERKVHVKPKSAPKKEKADPKYMLNKLETALRNNKLRARNQAKTDISTTSGEDSDDSLLFRSKTNRTLPRLPSQDSDYNTSAFNFNCLNALSCAVSNYEKIKEPNSSFFVASTEEPVYAEPYHYRKNSVSNSEEVRVTKREGSTRSEKSARNSLYYLSTPVLSGEVIMDKNESSTSQREDNKPTELKLSTGVNRQISAENSSLSSFTSDLDSTPSPMEDNFKIKSIIECYESRSNLKNASFLEESPKNCYGHTDSTNNRVENLRSALCQTLDKSFTNDSAMRDSDSENNENNNKVPDMIRKFETYIKGRPKYCKPKIHKDTLFYCCLIIEKVRDVAQIKFQFPNCVELPHSLESLCFPESNSTLTHITNAAQTYTLLITNDKGERTYGYCRRVLPEGGLHCLPLAYCILSKYRAPRFYKKILVELESRHGLPNKFRDELISRFYNQKFPKPGDSIKINLTNIEPNINKTEYKENLEESVDLVSFVHVNKTGEYGCINKVKKTSNLEQIFVSEHDIKSSCTNPSYIVENKDNMELVLTLHTDTRYEDSDLKRLHELPIDILLKVFSSMLLERKVVLISTMISKLSSCIDSLQSILYPFTWHHTFIPILPENLWDIVESPTPVICGVLSNEVLEDRTIENGIVVDIDNHTVQREEGDENKILSGSMQRLWKRSVALANKAAASMDYVHSVYLSDAYLQVFILCFKDYKKFFVEGIFQKEEFINHGKTKGIRRFLRMFTETYMFLAFLDTVANNPETLTEFDKKIEMYGSEDSKIILDKLFEWNHK